MRPAGKTARAILWAFAATVPLLAGCVAQMQSTGATMQSAPGPNDISQVRPQRDWSDAVLYFAILDRFADGNLANNPKVDTENPGGWHGGDLQGLTIKLDELADLGVTAIWITPIVKQDDYCPPAQGNPESGFTGGFEHCAFHGYWADDYKQIDSRFGTEADLRALVEQAHRRGIKVLLDVVFNHVGYDSRYLKDPATADWFRKKPVECSTDELNCQVGGLPDLRTELPAVRQYLFDAHLGLAKRTGLDGFRIDTLKHVEHEFWQEHRKESKSRVGEQFFLLGEVWGGSAEVLDAWFVNDEIDSGFDFTFKGSCESFVQGKGRTIAFSSYLEKRHRVRRGYHLAHYLSSHDEPMSLYNLGGDKAAFKLCVALKMASLGIPVIYYGEEVARPGATWPMNRSDMPWGSTGVRPGKGLERDEAMRAFYKNLIAARRANPALSIGAYKRLSADGDLLVFERSDAASGNAVVVAVNRGTADASVTVPAPTIWADAVPTDVLAMTKATRDGANLTLSVPARTAQVWALPAKSR
jgi:alpha-amylase